MTSAAQRAKEIAERITARIGFVIDGVVSRSIAAELEPEIQARMEAERLLSEYGSIADWALAATTGDVNDFAQSLPLVRAVLDLRARAERAEAAAASRKGRYAALRSPVTMRRRKSEESSR